MVREHHPEMYAAHQMQKNKPFEFVIVQINDVYEISPLDGGRVGGLARVATVINELKEKNPNTVTVLSGDFLSPSLISSLSEGTGDQKKRIAGEQIIATFNTMGLDYVTFGNHEFDIKESDLLARLDEAQFTFFSSNTFHKTGDTVQPFTQRGKPIPEVASHTFSTPTGDSLSLGFIGVTLPFNQRDYVYYEDVYQAGKAAFDGAKGSHDVVFAITHLAIEEDEQLAQTIPDLPFIIGGHEHSDTLSTVGNTRIAKADANARTIYIHWVTYHPENKNVDIWSQLMPITNDIKPDPKTAHVVANWERKADALINDMGYQANEAITSLPTPFDGRESMIRNFQTNLGRLIACSMQAADDEADFAFINSGSIRIDDQIQGKLLGRDILRTLPFGGDVVHGSFKGDVLQRILEAGFVTNRDAGGYFQTTSNVQQAGDSFTINGQPINPNATYEAAVPKFLSLGLEDNLDFMDEEGTYKPLANQTNADIRNLVIQYLKNSNWMEGCAF